MSNDETTTATPTMPPESRAAVEAWKARRAAKKEVIIDDLFDALRLRGFAPVDIGLSRSLVLGALFARTEAQLDDIIERTTGAS